VRRAQAAGSRVLLLGMRMPPSYGKRYTDAFSQVFVDVSNERQTDLAPFFLEGVAGNAALLQQDGLHPGMEAQSILLKNVWPRLEPLLSKFPVQKRNP
jgi:acyl-CoA thioesterase I